MQTKKRAKSVKFGKTKEESEEKKIVKEKELEKNEKIEEKEGTEVKEKSSESKSAKNESEEAEVSSKSESTEERYEPEDSSDEPMEVRLGKEDSEESHTEVEDEKKEKKVSVIESTIAEEPSPFGSFAKMPDEERHRRGNAWFFIMVTLVAFVIGLVCIAGIYYFTAGTSENKGIAIPNIIAKPTPTPTQTPTPTPKQLDLSTYDIQVLNGSGVTGQAAKVKTDLTSAGFSVTKTGNADTSDYEKTVIEAKKGTDDAYLKELIATLKKSYAIDSNIVTLKASETSDVIVIIGSTTAK